MKFKKTDIQKKKSNSGIAGNPSPGLSPSKSQAKTLSHFWNDFLVLIPIYIL